MQGGEKEAVGSGQYRVLLLPFCNLIKRSAQILSLPSARMLRRCYTTDELWRPTNDADDLPQGHGDRLVLPCATRSRRVSRKKPTLN